MINQQFDEIDNMTSIFPVLDIKYLFTNIMKNVIDKFKENLTSFYNLKLNIISKLNNSPNCISMSKYR